jgi:hypothetical protein
MSSRYGVTIDGSAPLWAQRMATDLQRVLTQISTDLKPKTFAKADLPYDGSEVLAIVSDEAGGPTLAFFEGTDWRRVQDINLVS